jgi:pilus assembly protein CpaC
MKWFKIIIALLVCTTFGFSNSLTQKELYDQNFSINKGAFKIVEFDKMIRNIKVSSEEFLEIDFLENTSNPLKGIKIFAKAIGNGNILITFDDATSMHININIVENLTTAINVAKQISPNLEITQTNGKIILKGTIQEQKTKDKILDLFAKSGIDLKVDLVDLTALENPAKMIRIKLYAVEINNSNGFDMTHKWLLSAAKSSVSTANNFQGPTIYNSDTKIGIEDTFSSILQNAVTLSGGLTSTANYLGNNFNAGLVLNYLSSEGVANILDETTLLTLENQDANFHAGGTIYLKVQTTTDQGVPSTEIQNINYGLQLDIKAENIVNEQFINLSIITKSTQIDWTNTVDSIPSFTEKSIKTNVVVGDKSTIILGGLISSSNSKDISKIPLLGDIPILGNLFTSKSFKEGKSELVFFITPEIVDAKKNNQISELSQQTAFTGTLKFNQKEKVEEEKIVPATKSEAAVETKKVQEVIPKTTTSSSVATPQEQQLKQFLGY